MRRGEEETCPGKICQNLNCFDAASPNSQGHPHCAQLPLLLLLMQLLMQWSLCCCCCSVFAAVGGGEDDDGTAERRTWPAPVFAIKQLSQSKGFRLITTNCSLRKVSAAIIRCLRNAHARLTKKPSPSKYDRARHCPRRNLTPASEVRTSSPNTNRCIKNRLWNVEMALCNSHNSSSPSSFLYY